MISYFEDVVCIKDKQLLCCKSTGLKPEADSFCQFGKNKESLRLKDIQKEETDFFKISV